MLQAIPCSDVECNRRSPPPESSAHPECRAHRERFSDPLGKQFRLGVIRDARLDNDEFVAASSDREVALSQQP